MGPDALEKLETSAAEIADLWQRFTVALSDAQVAEQSADGRYVDAYTAGLLLAKIVVRASGYRVKGGENHHDTFLVVPWLMGSEAQSAADALDAARKRRNATMYDAAGLVDDADVAALLSRVMAFSEQVAAWLRQEHPDLAP